MLCTDVFKILLYPLQHLQPRGGWGRVMESSVSIIAAHLVPAEPVYERQNETWMSYSITALRDFQILIQISK